MAEFDFFLMSDDGSLTETSPLWKYYALVNEAAKRIGICILSYIGRLNKILVLILSDMTQVEISRSQLAWAHILRRQDLSISTMSR